MATKKAPAKATATPRKKVTEAAAPQGETPVAAVAVSGPDAGPESEAAAPVSKREFTPITIVEVVDELPDTEDAAVSETVIQGIIEAGGRWVLVGTGGRKPNTTRNNVVKALAKRNVTAKTRIIGDKVYVSVTE